LPTPHRRGRAFLQHQRYWPEFGRLAEGNYLEATVLADVEPSMRIFREEVCGPVMRVTPFDTDEEAVSLANATKQAPAAYLWTSDLQRAHRLAPAIESVATWVNSHNARDLQMSSGGAGRENGRGSIDFYTQPRPCTSPRTTGRCRGSGPERREPSHAPAAGQRHPPSCCAEGRTGKMRRVTSSPAAEQHLRDLARLRRVRDRIDREYAQPLDVEALARGAHMSAGHLSREFRLAYGESPYSYLMTRRIERAMALLRRGDLSVTEVCFEVGCSSLGTFSTRFTELVGVPPSIYRRDAARATAGMPSCVAKQVTRPVRNREAQVTGPQLA
jgi:AraC-like DNA-binding protein